MQYIDPFKHSVASISFFENVNQRPAYNYNGSAVNTLHLHKMIVPMPLVFSKAYVIAENEATTNTNTASLSLSLGIYTITGATLSLLNSLSGVTNRGASGSWVSWVSLGGGGMSTLAAGDYYLGQLASNGTFTCAVLNVGGNNNATVSTGSSVYSILGSHSVSSSALPATLSTSDVTWTAGNTRMWYTVLSA